MGTRGLQEEVGSLAAVEILALKTLLATVTSGLGIRDRAYVVLGSQVVVQIQLGNIN